MKCSLPPACSHDGFFIKAVQPPEEACPLDGERRKAVEADSASGSVTARTYVGGAVEGSVEVSGVQIYQGQVLQVILTRWMKRKC